VGSEKQSDDGVRVAIECHAVLGEGLCWDRGRQTLWWVDIHGQRLLAWNLGDAPAIEWKSPQRIGWAIPCRDSEQLLVGLQEGFARVTPSAGRLDPDWVATPLGSPSLRLNDAAADHSGAVWAGSLNWQDESRPEGSLFRLAPDGTVRVVDRGYCVANGPALSPDQGRMLHTDSARRTIYAFDLDVAAGEISNKRIWRLFDEEEGYPDGMCFDAEGCVWVAHWGGGCISRFDADGQLVRRVSIPAPLVTNVCFGGEALDRLFVTTAQVGMDAASKAAYPLAGHLFEVDPLGVKGIESCAYGVERGQSF
jgi:xylono-1,5-lactonase